MAIKPTLFVGSSSEAFSVARQFATALDDVAHAIVWKDAPEFEPMRSTLDGLLTIADRYDFGVFIFTPDDEITSRGKKGHAARDNVVLELGVFLGRLGPDRTFAVVEEGAKPSQKVKAISDLFGITMPRFAKAPGPALVATVANAAGQLRPKILSVGRRREKVPLLHKWNYDRPSATFSATLSASKLLAAEKRLAGRRIALISRRQDSGVNAEDDTRLVISTLRAPSALNSSDLVLNATNKKTFSSVKPGDIMEGYILLVPEGVVLKKGMTLADMITAGCDIVDGGGKTVGKTASARGPL